MPIASQTQHKLISNTALPYITNTSLLNTNPHFISGSQNIMTSLLGRSERRPGFSKLVESSATAFTSLQRLFFWDRWVGSTPNGGAFVAMACDVSGGVAKVYKMVSGVDTKFQLLWTSASSEPFDFVVANNTVYFGNGTDMKKYDSSTLSNWGITAPAAGPTLVLLNAQLTLTNAANASGGNTVYTGTITGGGANAYVGRTYVVAGFTTPANNGTFTCTASTTTTLTLNNGAGVSEAHAATATDSAGQNVFTSWCYCTTYYNSNTTHESSPSPISACSGTFTSRIVQIGVTASADPQVTNIRIYRTPDGGAQDPALMQEIAGSPFPNSTGTVLDSTPDASLSTRVAPEFLRNDPPTPSKGFVTYGGRIWGFINNTTYFSGNEEISNGVPQECWPSGLAGNNYPWDKQVMAHAPLIDGVAIYTASRIYKIEGDSLDTFRRYQLLDKRGTRSRTAVASVGGSVMWLDTSNTIWISDIGEIGIPIRPDIASINPATAWCALHISGIYHWAILLDGANGILYIYDLDTERWMPPWDVGQSASALASYETSSGVIDLMLALNNTRCMKLVSNAYNDNGTTYVSQINTNLFRATPDDNPALRGDVDWVEIKTDSSIPGSVLMLTDDDPTAGNFNALSGEDSPDIVQGINLKTMRYPNQGQINPQCQMAAFQFQWPALNGNFRFYQIDISTQPVGA